MSPQYFSLNDYNEIIMSYIEMGSSYKLEENVFEIIKYLEGNLGIQNTFSTKLPNSSNQNFQNNKNNVNQYKKNRNSSRKEIDAEKSWHFKSTVLEKKEGTLMGDIRSYLNKMSIKNYSVNRDCILNIIKENIEKEESKDALQQVANNIFDIASTNKFYSEMYANLYKSLVIEFTIFNDILMKFMSTYTETMKNIQYVDPNENYDLFCQYNKKNDMRKSTTMFIINLIKNETLPLTILFGIFDEILCILFSIVDEPGHVNEVEEITENIALILGSFGNHLKGTEQMKKIDEISKWKSKDKESLSSRTVFKFMDMMDSLRKL